MSCPFCSIDLKRTRILFTSQYSKVLLSNPRLVPGHLLVVPIRHVEKLNELSSTELHDLCDTVIFYEEKILADFSSGCDIRMNYRPFLDENDLKVNHLHVHLLPRRNEDDYFANLQKNENELFTWLSEEEKKEMNQLFSTECVV